MQILIRIKRQENRDARPYWQEFSWEGESSASVAAVLLSLNQRSPLLDAEGKKAAPIAWERSCLVRKCGACAMRINGVPRLACAAFLSDLKGKTVVLEPLQKFPLVKDLIVDRASVFAALKKIHLWLESQAYLPDYTHAQRYQSAKCLLCGCCLEVCPNFSPNGEFGGAVLPVNAFRIFNEEQDKAHFQEMAAGYRKCYFEGCAASLACQDICPLHLPVEELAARSNAAAVWEK